MGVGSKLTNTARIRNVRGKDDCIRVGGHCVIAGELLVFAHGGQISIGDWCFVGEGARIWSASAIEVGNRVLISHNVNVFDSLTHPLDAKQRHLQFQAIVLAGHPQSIDLGEKPVRIGDDAWIGANSIILRGVTIGARAVVGAGSVVTEDVPEGCIVAGNPARIIRRIDEP